MFKKVTATDAKNNFGGLLEDVAVRGRIDIVRHGRVVAVMLSPQALQGMGDLSPAASSSKHTHMIPADLARAAKMVDAPSCFDDD
jgi:prevent-host-death family protein